jgi:predicted ATP-grasp superfamily ATP-dependent carboligase
MLDGTSSSQAHALQNVALIILSFLFLPIDSLILLISYALQQVLPAPTNAKSKNASQPRTILVTGVGMTKGLVLARLFHLSGHRVIGADFEPYNALVPGRVSRAIAKFYRLQKPLPTSGGSAPYVQGLLDVITKEKVDLWVSCSGVASAVEDGEAKEIVEARTKCKAIQFDVSITQTLHEKNTFIEYCQSINLTVPETHSISSKDAVQAIFDRAPKGRKYILKPIGMDDSARADMTLLPKSSSAETTKHISKLRVSEKSPWIVQQFVRGEEFCTHALVIKGKVKAFVACPSAELLMHYVALPTDSALSQAMQQFTEKFAASWKKDFTGHCSFDFLVEDTTPTNPAKIVLYPIECNPRAHTAVALFNHTPELADRYLEALSSSADTATNTHITYPVSPQRYFWHAHDFVTLILLPFASLLRGITSPQDALKHFSEAATHFTTWKDGTYELWDPLPWFFLYHVYWPMQFASCVWFGRKWSRVNVSTLKMFEC